jgi:hypothetical protein
MYSVAQPNQAENQLLENAVSSLVIESAANNAVLKSSQLVSDINIEVLFMKNKNLFCHNKATG